MWCRLLLPQVTQICWLFFLVLEPSVSAPINWSLVENLNLTTNTSLSDLFTDQPVDYDYKLYGDFHDGETEEATDEDRYKDEIADEDEDEDEDEMTDEIVPPPDLGLPGAGNTMRNLQREPPDYMMDLYKRFSHEKPFVHPTSNIVRSFMNVNLDDFRYNGTSDEVQVGNHTRVHKLVFNITSIAKDEVIDYAMLRLFTLVQQDRDVYEGVDRIVSVLQDRGRDLGLEQRYETLSSRHIYGQNSGWEAFDVTSAVRRWSENISCVQILEVRIESVFNVVSEGDMDIDTDPTHRNEPLLIIFSNNIAKSTLRDKELHEMLSHELDSAADNAIIEKVISESEVPHKHLNSSELSRVKRSKKKRVSCQRRRMYVSFQEINWHMWVIAPQGYEAYECVGKCYFPLSDHLSPTKHAVIQTLFHNSRPREVSRACCVPTKLNPISILYVDENDVMTYKYKYDDMKVVECGCR